MKKQIRVWFCIVLFSVATAFAVSRQDLLPFSTVNPPPGLTAEIPQEDLGPGGGCHCVFRLAFSEKVSRTKATGFITASPALSRPHESVVIEWEFEGAAFVEVRVGSPAGDLFAAARGAGKWTTADWVTDGLVIYLQDVSNGRPLVAQNTIARVKLRVR